MARAPTPEHLHTHTPCASSEPRAPALPDLQLPPPLRLDSVLLQLRAVTGGMRVECVAAGGGGGQARTPFVPAPCPPAPPRIPRPPPPRPPRPRRPPLRPRGDEGGRVTAPHNGLTLPADANAPGCGWQCCRTASCQMSHRRAQGLVISDSGVAPGGPPILASVSDPGGMLSGLPGSRFRSRLRPAPNATQVAASANWHRQDPVQRLSEEGGAFHAPRQRTFFRDEALASLVHTSHALCMCAA